MSHDRRIQALITALFATGAFSACSGPAESTPAATVTVTTTAGGPSVDANLPTSSSVPDGAGDGDSTPSSAADESSPGSIDDTSAPGSVDDPSAPPILGADVGARDLGLADFFHASDGWVEQRYSLVDSKDVLGIGGTLSSCGDGDYTTQTLELRLGAGFNTLKLTVGQADQSGQSGNTATIQFIGNGKQLDSQRISFYKQTTLTESLSGIVALRVRVFLDSDPACTPPTTVVLTGITAT